MTYRALVPVKSLAMVKSRLADHLTLKQRQFLALDMLHHVLTTLLKCNIFEQVSVVSPDARVLACAQEWGAHALIENAEGHNPALYAAALTELKTGVSALLTISADLPMLLPEDIQRLLDYSKEYPIVLASSQDGTGTNAVFMRPPLVLPYLFGVNSLQHYCEAAQELGIEHIVYKNTGLSLDIDTIDDLRTLYTLSEQWRERVPIAP